MLDISYIRTHIDEIKQNCHNRGVKVDIDQLIELDDRRRELMADIEAKRAERNRVSKTKPAAEDIARMRELGGEVKALEAEFETLDLKHKELLMSIPNLTHPDAPIGSEKDFVVRETHGEPPKFSFAPKDHEELLTTKNLIDFERGAKVTGSKFYFLKGDMVRLNLALIQYGIDVVTKHGFELVETPDLAKNEIMSGTGYQPRGEEAQVYSIENTDLSLIATAEITMGGYHANEILDLTAGPKKYVALSHCFRQEAGAYGKTSKGLYRVHQFTKLEMFVYCQPEDSEKLHQELLSIEKEIIDGLGLAYRVIDTPSGDLGGPAYRKYDLEAWMTMINDYGEVTSTSNCTDFQARRLNIRYRNGDGSTDFVHALNGTAVVLSRFPLAIVEQYQQGDGSIAVPEVLRKYMGGQHKIG